MRDAPARPDPVPFDMPHLPGRVDDAGGIAPGLIDNLRDALSQRPAAQDVTLHDLVGAIRQDGFAVLVLVLALLMLSPLSVVPGATTLLGLSIAAIMAQWLMGRRSVWLPRVVLDRRVPAARLDAALARLHGPVAWVERRLRPRQRWVCVAPFAQGPMLLVLAAASCAPLMEVIPASGSSVGAAIALFAAGMLARDGLMALAGAAFAFVLPATLWLLLT